MYKLTIIIPTKNRQFYCIESMKQIIDATNESVQIIIQDNSDDEKPLKDFCDRLSLERVLYHYNNRVLSFVDNFSEAVEFSLGEYVCMIGDDDGVLPRIMDIVEIAQKEDIDCFIPGLNSVYFWPSDPPIVKGAINGYEYISYLDDTIRVVNPQKSLKALLKRGFQDYQKLDVPRLYHGLVHKRVLNLIKNKAGKYFDGLTPDMFMAVALCFVCNKVLAQNVPVTISGICPKSGSSASASGAHTGSLSDAPHFIGHNNYEWDKRIPYVYSVETIWAETGLKSFDIFNSDKLSISFDSMYFLSRLWAKYPQFHNEIALSAKEQKISVYKICLYSYYIRIYQLFKKVIKRIMRKKKDVIRFYEIFDMVSAAEKADNYIINFTERVL